MLFEEWIGRKKKGIGYILDVLNGGYQMIGVGKCLVGTCNFFLLTVDIFFQGIGIDENATKIKDHH